MSSMMIEQLLYTAVYPALVAGLVMLVVWRPWRGAIPRPAWAGPPAIAGGFLLAYFLIGELPGDFPPTNDREWVFFIAIGAAIVGTLEAWLPKERWLHWLIRILALPAALVFALGFKIEHQWDVTTTFAWIGGLSAAGWAVMATFDVVADERRGLLMPLVLTLFAAATAGFLVLAGTARFSQLTGGLAAAVGPSIVFALWNRDVSLAHGATATFTFILVGLFASGIFGVTTTPTLAAFILLLSPLLLWIGRMTPIKSWGDWKGTVARLLLFAIPLAASVGMVATEYHVSEEEQQSEDEDYGYY